MRLVYVAYEDRWQLGKAVAYLESSLAGRKDDFE